jgi:hypothetical protein
MVILGFRELTARYPSRRRLIDTIEQRTTDVPVSFAAYLAESAATHTLGNLTGGQYFELLIVFRIGKQALNYSQAILLNTGDEGMNDESNQGVIAGRLAELCRPSHFQFAGSGRPFGTHIVLVVIDHGPFKRDVRNIVFEHPGLHASRLCVSRCFVDTAVKPKAESVQKLREYSGPALHQVP